MPVHQNVASIVSTVSKPYSGRSLLVSPSVPAKTSAEQKVCIHFCLPFHQCFICSKTSNFSNFLPIYTQVAENKVPVRQDGAGKMGMEPVSRPKSLPICSGVIEPTAVNQITLRQPLSEVNGRKVSILKIVNSFPYILLTKMHDCDICYQFS